MFMPRAPSTGGRSRGRRRSSATRAWPCRWGGRPARRPAPSARARGQGVVDVVEAGQREPYPRGPAGRHEIEGGALEPVELDRPGDDGELGPRVAALRAPVVAQVADVGRAVLVRRPAAEAVLRVGGVLKRGLGVPRVVEAEDERSGPFPCEIRDLRIVAVD